MTNLSVPGQERIPGLEHTSRKSSESDAFVHVTCNMNSLTEVPIGRLQSFQVVTFANRSVTAQTKVKWLDKHETSLN